MGEILSLCAFLAVLGLFLYMSVGSVRSMISRKNTPDKTVAAKVISKTEEVGQGEFKKDGLRLGKKTYSAVFSADGEELEFQLLKNEYENLEESESGFLTYRGKAFLGFSRDGLITEEKNETQTR